MRLAAQRVVAPGTGRQAIHSFYYSHGAYIWHGPTPRQLGMGTLQASFVELAPTTGNWVQSYLDVIAPDETPAAEVKRAFVDVTADNKPPPWRKTIGRCTFEANMIPRLQKLWKWELIALFDAATSVRIQVL